MQFAPRLCPAAASAEGHANARALAQRVRSHNAYHQHRLPRACALQALKLDVLKPLQVLLTGLDEHRACERTLPSAHSEVHWARTKPSLELSILQGALVTLKPALTLPPAHSETLWLAQTSVRRVLSTQQGAYGRSRQHPTLSSVHRNTGFPQAQRTQRTEHHAKEDQHGAVWLALVDQVKAGGQHHAARQRIGQRAPLL